jgi:hypothetical protein
MMRGPHVSQANPRIRLRRVGHAGKDPTLLLLISPDGVDEALDCAKAAEHLDIVDVKKPDEGSLGANFPWVIRQIRDAVPSDKPVSATVGDVPYKPGTVAQAALGSRPEAGDDGSPAGKPSPPASGSASVATEAGCRADRRAKGADERSGGPARSLALRPDLYRARDRPGLNGSATALGRALPPARPMARPPRPHVCEDGVSYAPFPARAWLCDRVTHAKRDLKSALPGSNDA